MQPKDLKVLQQMENPEDSTRKKALIQYQMFVPDVCTKSDIFYLHVSYQLLAIVTCRTEGFKTIFFFEEE